MTPTAPTRFVITEMFRHSRPESVRSIAKRAGFELKTVQGTSDSEIWSMPAEEGGFWIIRIDSQGHDTQYHFGSRPHYHKNWVATEAQLARYCEKYLGKAAVYDDAGVLLGKARDMKTDGLAKAQHILR